MADREFPRYRTRSVFRLSGTPVIRNPSVIPDPDRPPSRQPPSLKERAGVRAPYPNLTRRFNLTLRSAGPYHPCGA